MKKILLIILIIFSSCNTRLKFLDKYSGFKGEPKKVESMYFKIDYRDSLLSEKLAFKLITFYDEKGRKIKNLEYKSDGTPSSRGQYYNYDKYGNRIRTIFYNIDSTLNVENLYKFNDYGKETERIYIYRNKKSITKSIYDIKKRTKQIDGQNSIIKYDKKWKEIEYVNYDSIGKQESRTEFGYDQNGKLNSYKYYNSNNKLYKFSKLTFNKYNAPLISISYLVKDKDTIHDKTTSFKYEYDKNNNIIKEYLYTNEKLVWITRYIYEY